jgi:hypothetical protein
MAVDGAHKQFRGFRAENPFEAAIFHGFRAAT